MENNTIASLEAIHNPFDASISENLSNLQEFTNYHTENLDNILAIIPAFTSINSAEIRDFFDETLHNHTSLETNTYA